MLGRRTSTVLLLACGSLLAAGPSRSAVVPPPPPTRVDETVDVIQGEKISDPYRWLENGNDPAVQKWSDAQNDRTRSYLDALPTRQAVQTRASTLIKSTLPSYAHLQVCGSGLMAVYFDPAHLQQPQLVTLNADADPSSRHVVVDPNVLDRTGHTAFDWAVPSGDGAKVAVSLSRNGSEAGDLHVFDVATGRDLNETIPDVQYPTAGGSIAWARGSQGFWYTRYPGDSAPEADRHFNLHVFFHKLGTPWRQDPLIVGEADGLERISEIFLDNRCDLDEVMMMVQRGDGNTWAYYVLAEGRKPVQIGTYENGVVYATFGPDGAIYAISRKGTSNGRILKLTAPFARMGLEHAAVLVPESSVAIESGGAEIGRTDLSFDSKHLFVRDIIGGPNQVRTFTLDGKPAGSLPLPPIASNDEIVAAPNGSLLFDVSTYLRPTYYAARDAETGQTHETALKVVSPINYDDAEVVREFAASQDGANVPINIIKKKGTRLDGNNPVLLYGYGGYGISETPGFAGTFTRIWLDAGGVYAIANIRGGAEYGEDWHRNGMLLKKQNVFNDFAAAAQHLIDQGYTSHGKLALMGGSNGGLLMGAVMTQHPRLARAVVSAVGIYDMIRSELDPNGAFNVSEYGSVKDPAQFKALRSYSPYHHVKPNTPYPAVLFMTGATDGRVNPMQSRKMAAALQAATSSGQPILLRTSKDSGHGHGSSLDQRIAELTDEVTFLFDQLGVSYP